MADLQQFDQVQPPTPCLVLADKRLWLTEKLRDLNLPKARGAAGFPQDATKRLSTFSQGSWSRWLRHIPNRDIMELWNGSNMDSFQYTFLDAEPLSPEIRDNPKRIRHQPFKQQLLKWVGNKQRFAHEIADILPASNGRYFEPFLGSGAVLGTLVPERALGSDCFGPLINIWRTLRNDPETLKSWYTERLKIHAQLGKQRAYEEVLASYNARPNAADFLFLTRTCYGGVVRFRRDGYMSTPCGVHEPVSSDSFAARVDVWHKRTRKADFERLDYREAMARATAGDVVYCDPPYSDTQAILYGAQDFNLSALMEAISACKDRGVFVALSIDGSKKSGQIFCDVQIPSGLFEREVSVNVGRSMLRRFQREGETLEDDVVRDRLLLTY